MKKKKRMKDDTKRDKRHSTRTKFTKKRKKNQNSDQKQERELKSAKHLKNWPLKISGITSEEIKKKRYN